MEDLARSIDLPVSPRSIVPLREFTQRCFTDAGVGDEESRELLAALDESLSPLLTRNQDEERSGHVCLEIHVNDTRVRLLVRDESTGVEHESNGRRETLQRYFRPTREVGLSLLRQVMDELNYRYTRGFQNELEMIKFV